MTGNSSTKSAVCFSDVSNRRTNYFKYYWCMTVFHQRQNGKLIKTTAFIKIEKQIKLLTLTVSLNLELPHRHMYDRIFYIQRDFTINHKICLGCSHTRLCCLTESLIYGGVPEFTSQLVSCSHSQTLLCLDRFLKPCIFPCNTTIFTVVEQEILNYTGLYL